VCQVFVVGPNKRLKLSILYPATTGRNFESVEYNTFLNISHPLHTFRTSQKTLGQIH